MSIKIQKTSNIKAQKKSIAIVGDAKTGKTSLAKTIKGKTLICNADKGILSLKDKPIDYISVNTWDEVVEFMKFITGKKFKEMGFEWIVLDSVSAIAQILENHLEKEGIKGYDFWGEYKKLIGGILATVRDSEDFNSICIFELQEKENSSGLLEKKFGLNGAMMSKAPYFFDFVFATKKNEIKDKPTQYLLQTANKKDYKFLGARGVTLNDYEPANIEHILAKLNKGSK